MFSSLVLIFLASALAPILVRHKFFKYLILLPVGFAFAQVHQLWATGEAFLELPWGDEEAAYGFRVSFLADGLSLVLAQLVLGVGFFVQLYTLGYFSEPPKAARFSSHLLLFMGAMLGVVVSNNLLLLFVFWELTSVSSYLLIGFKHEDPASRKAALQALLVTGVGGLCMLAGFLILGAVTGTFELDQLSDGATLLHESSHYGLVCVLIFLGCLTKSAQFPFHFWLPNAMTAPTPASSYLHSATMVKAGVFLLLRLSPLLGGTPLWQKTLMGAGGVTLALATVLAVLQSDLKKVLAYTTLAALGTLVLLIGVDTTLSLNAAILFTLAHALYKAPLFLMVGNVDHECGTRDLRQLFGLRLSMPITFGAVLLCSVAMASLPPFFSFIAKESVLEALLGSPLLLGLVVVSSSIFVSIALVFVFQVFGGDRVSHPVHEAPWPMAWAPSGLALVALGLSVFPQTGWLGRFRDSAVSALTGGELPEVPLGFWHGWNAPLACSLLALVGGVIFFAFWSKRQQEILSFGARSFPGPARAYDWLLEFLVKGSKVLFGWIQHGHLSYYLMSIFLFLVLLMRIALLDSELTLAWSFGDLNMFEIVVAFAISAGGLLALRSATALASLTALGLVGFGIGFLYLINGAPDLALTQFMVETLTLVLLVLSFRRLPKEQERAPLPYALFVSVLAGVFALGVGFLTLSAAQSPARASIREYFGDFSLTMAHGRNVVNVILVDFRGLDTMGEITVLSIAAVGVFTLLQWGRKQGVSENE